MSNQRFVIYKNNKSHEIAILDTEEDNGLLFSWGFDDEEEGMYLEQECKQVVDMLNYLN